MNAPQLIAFGIVVALVAISADIAAGADAAEIQRNENISHLWAARARGVLLLLPCIGFQAAALTTGVFSALLAALGNVCIMWLVFAAEFWLIFDLRLNQRRGLPWFYLGTGTGAAAIDSAATRFLRPFGQPGKVLAAVKCLVLAVALMALFAAFTRPGYALAVPPCISPNTGHRFDLCV